MRTVLALLVWLVAAVPAAIGAPTCSVPDDLVLSDLRLPHVRAGVASQRSLTILSVGGSSTAGTAAQGAGFAYPARLAARLRDLLPGVAVVTVNRGARGRIGQERVAYLRADLAQVRPDLVIWDPGASGAGKSEDLGQFIDSVAEGVALIREAQADLILMDLQYAPSIATLIDLARYNFAIAGVANAEDVTVFRRNELMRRWNDDGSLVLDGLKPADRLPAIRRLFDCLAAGLADGIAVAAKAPL